MASAGNGLGRRDLFKGAVAAGLTAGLLGPSPARARPPSVLGTPAPWIPDRLQAPPRITQPAGTELFWNEVRKAFPLSDGYIHMNTGTTGSQPVFSLNNLAVYNAWKSRDPRDWQANLAEAFPDVWRTLAQRQADVAATYGANANEIVLSYNTSDACNLIFAGTPWKPGDRIVTTTMEHPGMVGPLCWARDYHGVDVAIVEIPTDFT
ncbi:MAG TPA: aminotransferase class V-fold PLP-dependent enzyme, partial [Anaeromyxobacteraceae bacterium]|nr:aminotransferase class V-fold PLP-dependent enzyme [Anaeromyxobacteraceae bacterium]